MTSRLSQHLVARGLLTPQQMEAALRRQSVAGGGSLDTALLELSLISEPDLLAEMGETSGFRPVNLLDFEPNPEVAPLIPAKIAERFGVVPLSLDGPILHIASCDPVPKEGLEELALLLGKTLEAWVAIEARVRDWIATVYATALPPRFAQLRRELDQKLGIPPAAADPGGIEDEEPIIDLVQRKPVQPVANAAPTLVPLLDAQQPPASPAAPSAASPLAYGDLANPRSEPHFVVFPNPGAVAFSPSSQTPPPLPRSDEPVVEWTLTQARAALHEASKDRNKLLDVALRYARRTFDFAAAFSVIGGAANGFSAKGEGAESSGIAGVTIPLDASSVFRTVAVTRGSYVGPLPADALSLRYLQAFGRSPRTVFLYPIEVKSRLVAILYGDSGNKPVSQRKLSDLLLFSQDLPGAFHELIQFRKQQAELKLPDVEAEPVARESGGSWSVGWSPFVTATSSGLGRAASLPAFVQADASRPPPDFGAVLRRLTGPDPAMRAHAMAELSRAPQASAKVLSQVFPGPTAWTRLPVNELPDADELGPIPGALSRLGRAGAQALAPLLDSDDGDLRYFALLTAGNLPYAELVSGLLRGLFDLEPDLSSAARAAATAFKRLPRFDAAMRDLRQELTSRDSLRRSLAARALGVLHDRDSVDGLIGLTGSDDPMCAQAASDALREITRANFGTDTRAWTRWWAENRSRRRAEWLVLALRHHEFDVRLSASEELIRVANDSLGYQAEAAEPQREPAVRRWEETVSDPVRGRRFSVL